MLHKLLRPALLATLALATAPAAHAGDLSLGIHFGKRSKSIHATVGNVRVGYRTPRRVCAPRKVWVPGRYDTVTRQVWIPGGKEKVWIEPLYQTRYDECGRPYQVLVRDGYWTVRQLPGYYETRCEQVWVPGYWKQGYASY
ncbi:MAG: hypothetical protein AAF682_17745 [Planctomycetota bacterium]